MGPFDVSQGPVSFERRYQAVPRPPSPNLGGLGIDRFGADITKGQLIVGGTVMLGACGYAILAGKKNSRKKNAKLLAGAAFLAWMALNPTTA